MSKILSFLKPYRWQMLLSVLNRELERRIKQIDKARAYCHRLISRTQWGDKQAYQLCVNTTGFEIADLTAPIASLAEKYFERRRK